MNHKKIYSIILSSFLALSAAIPDVKSSASFSIRGDINCDGGFDIADLVTLQKYLLSDDSSGAESFNAADLCSDGRLDVFDLTLMRKELISPVTTDRSIDIRTADNSTLIRWLYNAEKSQQRLITPSDIIELSKKGMELTLFDLSSFICEDVGSGIYVFKYEIEDHSDYALYVGTDLNTEYPMYARLKYTTDDNKYSNITIDIRSEEFQELLNFDWWHDPENNEENRAAALAIGKNALDKLKDGTIPADITISSENADEYLDHDAASLFDPDVFCDLWFNDDHTAVLSLNKGLLDEYGYLITDGTVTYQQGTDVPVPGKGYDGGSVYIDNSYGNLYYFFAGT